MNRRHFIWIIPIIIAGLIIAFLLPIRMEEHPAELSTEQLLEKQWILQSLKRDDQEIALSPDIGITIQFDDSGTAKGSGGCNMFSGSYEATGEYQIFAKLGSGSADQIGVGGRISFGPIASTEMACVESGRMDKEQHFFATLTQITRFEVTSDGLKLLSEDGQIFLDFVLK